MPPAGGSRAPAADESVKQRLLHAADCFERTKADIRLFLEIDVATCFAPEDLVGQQVRVFWPDDDVWYLGTAVSYNSATAEHAIDYVDGTQEKIVGALERLRLPLCAGQPLPSASPESMERYASALSKRAESLKSKDTNRGRLEQRASQLQAAAKAVAAAAAAAVAAVAVKPSDSQQQQQEQPATSVSMDEQLPQQQVENTSATTVPTPYLIGEVVWGKVNGYPDWPAIVVTRTHATDGKFKPLLPTAIPICYFGTFERQLLKRCAATPFIEGAAADFHARPTLKRAAFASALCEVAAYMQDGEIPEGMFPCGDDLVSDSEDEPDSDQDQDEISENEKEDDIVVRKQKKARIYKLSSGGGKGGNSSIIGVSGGNAGRRRVSLKVGKSLRVLSLGQIEWIHPRFHNEKSIWPVGYIAERAVVTPAGGKKAVLHTCEVLQSPDGSGPVFRVTPGKGKTPVEATTPSKAWAKLYDGAGIAGHASSAGATGPRMFGLMVPLVVAAIQGLPNAARCERYCGWSDGAAPAVPPLSKDEQKQRLIAETGMCRLPEGVHPSTVVSPPPGVCCVCLEEEEDEEDLIVQCDGCKIFIHMACYGVREPPHGRLWLCDVCTVGADQPPACALCPISGGAMKRTTCGQWCHSSCSLWLPEPALKPEASHLGLHGLIDGLGDIHPSRRKLKCQVCQQMYGACVQCCDPACYISFHLMCARQQGYTTQLVADSDSESDGDEEEERRDGEGMEVGKVAEKPTSQRPKREGPQKALAEKITPQRRRLERPEPALIEKPMPLLRPEHALSPRSLCERTNWLNFPEGTNHQSVTITQSQVKSGTMSIPVLRGHALFATNKGCTVTLEDADTGKTYAIPYKRYPSQPTQDFLQKLKELFKDCGMAPQDVLSFQPVEPGVCRVVRWPAAGDLAAAFRAKLGCGWMRSASPAMAPAPAPLPCAPPSAPVTDAPVPEPPVPVQEELPRETVSATGYMKLLAAEIINDGLDDVSEKDGAVDTEVNEEVKEERGDVRKTGGDASILEDMEIEDGSGRGCGSQASGDENRHAAANAAIPVPAGIYPPEEHTGLCHTEAGILGCSKERPVALVDKKNNDNSKDRNNHADKVEDRKQTKKKKKLVFMKIGSKTRVLREQGTKINGARLLVFCPKHTPAELRGDGSARKAAGGEGGFLGQQQGDNSAAARFADLAQQPLSASTGLNPAGSLPDSSFMVDIDSTISEPFVSGRCARAAPLDAASRRGHREPDSMAGAVAKRRYVCATPLLLRGPLSGDNHVTLPSFSVTYPPPEWAVQGKGTGEAEGAAHRMQHSVDVVGRAPPPTAGAAGAAGTLLLSVVDRYLAMRETEGHRVTPGKSAIHGWGAFARVAHAKDDMVIEYVGELVRPSVADARERGCYDSLVGAGTYIFRLNMEECVDATRAGNIAHLLNHSCEPNCFSRTISVWDNELGRAVDHVVISALRDIPAGEELTYDYRFSGDEQLTCNCGAMWCRGMVNKAPPARGALVPRSQVKPYLSLVAAGVGGPGGGVL